MIQFGSIDHDDVLPIRKGLAVDRVARPNQAASLERGSDDGKSHDSVIDSAGFSLNSKIDAAIQQEVVVARDQDSRIVQGITTMDVQAFNQ